MYKRAGANSGYFGDSSAFFSDTVGDPLAGIDGEATTISTGIPGLRRASSGTFRF